MIVNITIRCTVTVVKNGVLQWLFIFDAPSHIIKLPWKLLTFPFKTHSFLETGLSLKLISLLIVVLTDVFTMDIKSHVYLYIFCYTPMWVSDMNNHWSTLLLTVLLKYFQQFQTALNSFGGTTGPPSLIIWFTIYTWL